MKTRTLRSLVFGLALMGTMSLMAGPSPQSQSPVSSTNASSAAPILPAPPETAPARLVSEPGNQLPDGVSLSGWVGEFVKLAQAGLESNVLLSFIDSAGTFNLTADHIIYLHDIGVPSEAITSIIQHDAEIAAGIREPGSGTPTAPSLRFPPLPGAPESGGLFADSFDSMPLFGEPEPFYLDLSEPETDTPEKSEISPVRKPYPVQLTSPIVVLRTEGRMPNLMLLHSLP